MANDRMGLRCKFCCTNGAAERACTIWFAKTFGSGWYIQPVWEENLVATMNEFFVEHNHQEIYWDNFELIYEGATRCFNVIGSEGNEMNLTAEL